MSQPFLISVKIRESHFKQEGVCYLLTVLKWLPISFKLQCNHLTTSNLLKQWQPFISKGVLSYRTIKKRFKHVGNCWQRCYSDWKRNTIRKLYFNLYQFFPWNEYFLLWYNQERKRRWSFFSCNRDVYMINLKNVGHALCPRSRKKVTFQ